jgi:hypothetical protein
MLLMLALVFALQAPTPVSNIHLTKSPGIDVDLGKVKGQLVRQLAWSPDGKELYLMTYDANKDASIKKVYHTLISLPDGRMRSADAQPAWATAYWTWKSAQASPDNPALKIDVSQEKRKENAVSIPMGGDMARGGTGGDGVAGGAGGLSTESAIAAKDAMQMSDVYMLKLKGEVIGEFVNHPTVPGLTFGWGPKGTGLIAYADQKTGRLALMNQAGDKQKVDGTRDVVLPAWSESGEQLAYLERRGRAKFVLFVASVQK